MSVGQQVCVIYTGVRGYLDSIKPEEVVDFEEKFNEHITTAQAGNYFDHFMIISSVGLYDKILFRFGQRNRSCRSIDSRTRRAIEGCYHRFLGFIQGLRSN